MGCNVTTALIDTHCSLHIVNMPAADKIVKTSGSALMGQLGPFGINHISRSININLHKVIVH